MAVIDVLREWLFGLTLALSALLHAMVVFWLSWIQFEPPDPIAPQQGKASVRLAPSEDEQRQPPLPQPPTVVESPPLPELLPEPSPLPPPTPLQPPVPPQPEKQPEPTEMLPAPRPERVKRPAPIAAVRSPASEAAEGAVDDLPREAINPAPPYPADSLAAGLQGTVWLRIKTDATGKVVTISLYASSQVTALDESALRTVRRWVFYPARRNGVAVPYEFLKPIEFSITRR